MLFITLIAKNLARQRVRTGLTVLGISIGITTVVALGVITSSLRAVREAASGGDLGAARGST